VVVPASSPNDAGVFQSTLIVNGRGSSQTSTLAVMTGTIANDCKIWNVIHRRLQRDSAAKFGLHIERNRARSCELLD
jgi:hypothetical protein